MSKKIVLPSFNYREEHPLINLDLEENFTKYDFKFHKKEREMLDKIAMKGLDFDLLLTGQNGSGRLTLVKYFLKKLLGEKVFTTLTPINKDLEDLKSTKGEILGNNKMFFVSQFVSTNNLIKFLESIKNQETSEDHYRPIVIIDLENHKDKFYNILGSFIESRQGHYPIIGIFNTSYHLPRELRSYFCLLKIARPTTKEIEEILEGVIKKRNLNVCSKYLERIIEQGEGNLQSTLFYLDLTTTEEHQYQKYHYHYRDLTKEMVALIANPNKKLEDIYYLRSQLQEIYLGVNDQQFLNWVLAFLLRCKLSETTYNEIIELTSETDLSLQESRIQFYCLEHYILKLFEII